MGVSSKSKVREERTGLHLLLIARESDAPLPRQAKGEPRR
jgi:hypothetical protein